MKNCQTVSGEGEEEKEKEKEKEKWSPIFAAFFTHSLALSRLLFPAAAAAAAAMKRHTKEKKSPRAKEWLILYTF